MPPTSFSTRNSASLGLPSGSVMQRLLGGVVRPGTVRWIGLRPARHAPMQVVSETVLDLESGVVGDHYAGRSGTRQVSLIGHENLAAIGAFMGGRPADPALLRRNIVVCGINLLALKGRRFCLGGAVLAYSGDCHPCSRMEALLGPGGYNAVRGQGGILARVLTAGRVAIGDTLTRLEDDPAQAMLPL